MKTIAISTIVILLTLNALAQTSPSPNKTTKNTPSKHPYTAADLDQDGTITEAEFNTYSANRFKKLDSNQDGRLSTDELTNRRQESRKATNKAAQHQKKTPTKPRVRAEMLKKADSNDDKKVTYEELKFVHPEFPKEAFKRLDSNHDGFLTNSDRLEHKSPQGNSGARFKEADTNNDGKISFDEAKSKIPGMSRERFDKRDKNKDGFLSKEDRKEF